MITKEMVDKEHFIYKELLEIENNLCSAIKSINFLEKKKIVSTSSLVSNLEELKKINDLKIEESRIRSKELVDKCSHRVWEDDGHDSHYNYEKCSICGKTRKC